MKLNLIITLLTLNFLSLTANALDLNCTGNYFYNEPPDHGQPANVILNTESSSEELLNNVSLKIDNQVIREVKTARGKLDPNSKAYLGMINYDLDEDMGRIGTFSILLPYKWSEKVSFEAFVVKWVHSYKYSIDRLYNRVICTKSE